MIAHLKKEFRFEASHQLPNHDGKCARLHGHSWVLNVWVSGPINNAPGPKEGMAIDYADIKKVVQPIVDLLDHRHLGTGLHAGVLVPPDNLLLRTDGMMGTKFPPIPTSENILMWIASQLPPTFNWQCLEICETCTSAARIYATDYAQHFKKGIYGLDQNNTNS
jgi:6-pyruvoyltetrahydropterin/6-carboxytetrahydropterin synthase